MKQTKPSTRIFVNRLEPLNVDVRGYEKFSIKQKGSINNIKLTQSPRIDFTNVLPEQIVVRVKAVGLNFRDVLNVLDLYPGDPGPVGSDYAGIVIYAGKKVNNISVGDTVLGIHPGCIDSFICAEPNLCQVYASNLLSYNLAASLPVILTTVFETLHNIAKIKPNQNVLIHAVTGGVGCIAIDYCKYIGANVYGTCGSDEKKNYAIKVGVKAVFSSRDANKFKEEMNEYDTNLTFDCVINCLTQDFIPFTLDRMKPNGHFIELGKRDIWPVSKVNSNYPNVKYSILAIDEVIRHTPLTFKKLLGDSLYWYKTCRKENSFQLSITPFIINSSNQLQEAFRYLQKAKHIGKVVLQMPNVLSTNINDVYIITGGKGTIALEVLKFLLNEGCSNIYLLCRTTKINESSFEDLKRNYEGSYITLKEIICDVTDENHVLNCLSILKRKGLKLKGIFHLAGKNIDSTLTNIKDIETISAITQPKIKGLINFHNSLIKLSLYNDLDFFINFSSISAIFGNVGQICYSAANSYLDEFSEKMPQKFMSIQWGPWNNAGMAKTHLNRMKNFGITGISNEVGIKILYECLKNKNEYRNITAVHLDINKFVSSHITIMSAELNNLLEVGSKDKRNRAVNKQFENLSEEELTKYITNKVLNAAESLTGNKETPKLTDTISTLGIDSIAAVEFRNLLSSELDVKISVTALIDYPTLGDVTNHIIDLVKLNNVNETNEISRPLFEIIGDEVSKNLANGVAIIGMSCRLPRGDNPERFWNTLLDATDCIIDVPISRWSADKFYNPDPDAPGVTTYTRRGGFVENVHLFDPHYFGIGLVEAKSMDPQQRILLTCSAETFADAGYTKNEIANSDLGCFIGCCNADWVTLHTIAAINVFSGTSGAASILSNRINYLFKSRGPSATIDTACSSTLVALDIAFNKLILNQVNWCILGGVNIMLSPNLFVAFSKARMLSKDCYCKTFDESANGYARGEGCATFLLKNLHKALKDNDKIHAVIKGSFSNHVGQSASLTAPNGPAQAECFKKALKIANIMPNDVSYIETHGTGTPLGDPIEIGAIKTVYGGDRAFPLILGAGKTNIGHLEGASGAAALVKVILCLKYKKVPMNLHFKKLNPYIDMKGLNAIFPTSVNDLNLANNEKLYSALSSFGFGGSNAHVIMEAYNQEKIENKIEETYAKPKVCFLFTGQGSQQVNMALDLYSRNEIFRKEFNQIAEAFIELDIVDIREYIYPTLFPKLRIRLEKEYKGEDVLDKINTLLYATDVAQPAIFAFELALVKYWKHLNIIPDYVIGHSLGEYVAAVLLNIMSQEDAIKLVAIRAKLMQKLPLNEGVMYAFKCSEAIFNDMLEKITDSSLDRSTFSIAAINARSSIVVSGEKNNVEKLLEFFPNISKKKLNVSHAFHSPMMNPIIDEFYQLSNTIHFLKPNSESKFISTVTCSVETDIVAGADYWRDHISKPVRFYDSVKQLIETYDVNYIIEIGPKPILINLVRQQLMQRTRAASDNKEILMHTLDSIDGEPVFWNF
uniref:Uncharacterized protein LOC113788671 n=1 Tax=Dermatophagoides pteronyssinus TaxID=6956 RepID=A0A6P6XKL4_DERPT|nr:uncharacterized protein LOC113788671 [Dermatophagoides pteronyssinus]